MSSLFSHAGTGADPEIRAEAPGSRIAAVVVPAGPEHAFEGFTDYIHLWWPTECTDFGEGTFVEFDDGVLIEESDDGEEAVWARERSRATPHQLVLSWENGWDPFAPSRVRLDFARNGTGTTVTLTQDGWESGSGGREQYDQYNDWPRILDRYLRFMGGDDAGGDNTDGFGDAGQ